MYSHPRARAQLDLPTAIYDDYEEEDKRTVYNADRRARYEASVYLPTKTERTCCYTRLSRSHARLIGGHMRALAMIWKFSGFYSKLYTDRMERQLERENEYISVWCSWRVIYIFREGSLSLYDWYLNFFWIIKKHFLRWVGKFLCSSENYKFKIRANKNTTAHFWWAFLLVKSYISGAHKWFIYSFNVIWMFLFTPKYDWFLAL